ncbi:SDR family oxidoreductase [Roseimicrobium gellanilyticum]|nr:SDR family oxidoreductase [Roseimicrobium gellanilyticum]
MTNLDAITSTDQLPVQARTHWSASDIPSQHGRLAVITGTGGIGFETALALARAGGEVIIAGRNAKKGADAVARICADVRSAKARFEQVDLASLESITDFGTRLRSQHKSLNLLVNNAAVMNPPDRQETADGFELQFGTNYLGHFALTLQLLPLLCLGRDARIITLSSIAARNGAINFEDLQAERSYKPMRVYSQSKLACLMFALEFQRRSKAGRLGIASIAAHPGISRTDLLHNAPGRWSGTGMMRTFLWFLFQPASQGALSSLFAATSPLARGGGYYGPARLGGMRGAPAEAAIPKRALSLGNASRLWEISERLTGMKMLVPGPTEM